MRRRLTEQEQGELRAPSSAADQVETMTVGKARRRKEAASKGPTPSAVRKSIERAVEAVKDGRWQDVGPPEIVGLWAWLHGQIYGVEAVDEVTGREGLAARVAAKRMLRSDFDGSASRMVDFVRWSWAKERRTEQWRRENEVDGRRMTWRSQFSAGKLTDYRIAKKRRA